MVKVVFFGSSEYSVIILKQLLNDFEVPLVVTKTDKPSGRNQKITPNPVAQFALDHNLNLLQVEEFDVDSRLKIQGCHAEVGLCVAFGPPYFDQGMIDLFPNKIINIHPSPLPKYRGATPGPWQIINGETTSAVTFFQIDLLPDHGPIVTKIPFAVSENETSATFYQKAFTLAADNLTFVFKKYLETPQNLELQDHSQKSYFPKLTKDSGKIDHSWDQDKICRFINAMNPWPIAWTYIQSKDGTNLKMKVFSAIKKSGNVEFEKVQIEGKKPTLWSEISPYYSLEIKKT